MVHLRLTGRKILLHFHHFQYLYHEQIYEVEGITGALSISLGSLKTESDGWNNVVIEGQNLFAAREKSSAELLIT